MPQSTDGRVEARTDDRAHTEDLRIFLLLAAPIFVVTLGIAALVVIVGSH